MSRHLFVVATYAKEGRAQELTEWFDRQHIPDLLAVPGFVKATRYRATAVKLPPGVTAPDCVTFYELEAQEPMSVIAELGRRTAAGSIPFTDALDGSRTIAYLASPA